MTPTSGAGAVDEGRRQRSSRPIVALDHICDAMRRAGLRVPHLGGLGDGGRLVERRRTVPACALDPRPAARLCRALRPLTVARAPARRHRPESGYGLRRVSSGPASRVRQDRAKSHSSRTAPPPRARASAEPGRLPVLTSLSRPLRSEVRRFLPIRKDRRGVIQPSWRALPVFEAASRWTRDRTRTGAASR